MDTMELLKKSRDGDREARNQLVEENIGLVWNIVKRFIGRGYEAEDIFQIGCIGLIKAIDHFDFSYDVKFSTYAVPMITGQIKRFLRDDGMIKVSRTLKENGWKVSQAQEALRQELGRNATVDEIAAATELEPGEIVLAMEANREVGTIDRTLYQEGGKELPLIEQVVQMPGNYVGQVVGGEASVNIDERDPEKEEVLNHMLIKQLLQGLGERERQLIEYRYFEEMTQSEVAKKLNISQVQVSRLEKKILLQMRKEARLN
ncbi:MAG: SigB/SigF/SigG family RNA polymerase sigma factor [Lachnospiraceae bacterium]|nr:SigB/SigF/SigG family RNA polymerase sigma factor [Lachnospiraceae bacterium]